MVKLCLENSEIKTTTKNCQAAWRPTFSSHLISSAIWTIGCSTGNNPGKINWYIRTYQTLVVFGANELVQSLDWHFTPMRLAGRGFIRASSSEKHVWTWYVTGVTSSQSLQFQHLNSETTCCLFPSQPIFLLPGLLSKRVLSSLQSLSLRKKTWEANEGRCHDYHLHPSNHHPLRNGTTCSKITTARHCQRTGRQTAVEHLGRSFHDYNMRGNRFTEACARAHMPLLKC